MSMTAYFIPEPALKGNVLYSQQQQKMHSKFKSSQWLCSIFTITFILQVLNQITGEFEDVPTIEDGIFINIGNILQIWSGDKLLANVSLPIC